MKNVDDLVDRAVEMYKYHPSIILINKKVDNQNKFSFEQVTLRDIVKEIKDINPKKSSIKDCIPPKVLKIRSEATTFQDSLKLADITTVFKKKDPSNKTNYYPVIVKLIVSKSFEKIV